MKKWKDVYGEIDIVDLVRICIEVDKLNKMPQKERECKLKKYERRGLKLTLDNS